MLSSASPSFSKFHPFFNKEKTSTETKTKLDFISSIWDDYHILRLDEKNWQWLLCTKLLQGINATKALSQVLGSKVLHIKSSYDPKEKYHITRYQELHHFKQGWKGVLLDYLEKTKASIASLHNKLSTVIESTIYRSYRIITSSNDTNSSKTSGSVLRQI